MHFRVIFLLLFYTIFIGCKNNYCDHEGGFIQNDELMNELTHFIKLKNKLGNNTDFILEDIVNNDSLLIEELRYENFLLQNKLNLVTRIYERIKEPRYITDYNELDSIESYRIIYTHWPSRYTLVGKTEKIIRIEKQGNSFSLFYKIYKVDSDTTSFFKLNEKFEITEQDWKNFNRKVNISKFWMLPENEFEPIDRRGSKYHPQSYQKYYYTIEGCFAGYDTFFHENSFYTKSIDRSKPCGDLLELINVFFELAEKYHK